MKTPFEKKKKELYQSFCQTMKLLFELWPPTGISHPSDPAKTENLYTQSAFAALEEKERNRRYHRNYYRNMSEEKKQARREQNRLRYHEKKKAKAKDPSDPSES